MLNFQRWQLLNRLDYVYSQINASLYAFIDLDDRSMDKTALPHIHVPTELRKWKSAVIYLGSRLAEDGSTTEVFKHRICSAESLDEWLNKRVFRRQTVGGRLKGQFMRSSVFTSLLYRLEHWALGARYRCRLDGYFLRLDKRVLQLWYDYLM